MHMTMERLHVNVMGVLYSHVYVDTPIAESNYIIMSRSQLNGQILQVETFPGHPWSIKLPQLANEDLEVIYM